MSLDNRPLCVLDTNIWVSAFVFGGIVAQIPKLIKRREILSTTSEVIIAETVNILARKFKYPKERCLVQAFVMRELSAVIDPTLRVEIIKAKDSDNRILECAVEAGADYIITGDRKHLLPLVQFRKIKIVTVRQFFDLSLLA